MELTQDLHASPRLAWDVTERLLVRVTEILDRSRLTHIDLGPALSRRCSDLEEQKLSRSRWTLLGMPSNDFKSWYRRRDLNPHGPFEAWGF